MERDSRVPDESGDWGSVKNWKLPTAIGFKLAIA
jgi:hypothetical protein